MRIVDLPGGRLIVGDVLAGLASLPDESVQCVVTSPPYYGQRDYCVPPSDWPEIAFRPMADVPEIVVPATTCCLGMETSPHAFTAHQVLIFREVRRVLRKDGTLWANFGDSYASGGRGGGGTFMSERRDAAWRPQSTLSGWRSPPPGLKHKDLLGIPWRVAFALQADGWTLRQDEIWSKLNAMPESVRDRCVKSHEYFFLLTKSPRYAFDLSAIKEKAARGSCGSRFDRGKTLRHQQGRVQKGERAESGERIKRSVWRVSTKSYRGAHYAVYPPKLIEPCILAGCHRGGVVLDPFMGSGTTAAVALEHGRRWVGIDLDPRNVDLVRERLAKVQPRLAISS